LTFQVGDEIECLNGDAEEEWWEGKVLRTGLTGVFPVLFTAGWEHVAANMNTVPPVTRQTSLGSNRPSILAGKHVSVKGSKAPSMISEQSGQCENDLTEPKYATALYAYEATCVGELSIEQGERITIISMNTGSEQWWKGQGKKGTGQFPANYVELETKERYQVKALYDYAPTSPGDLSFKTGDVVTVYKSTDQSWWEGEMNGKIGTFPATYVERV